MRICAPGRPCEDGPRTIRSGRRPHKQRGFSQCAHMRAKPAVRKRPKNHLEGAENLVNSGVFAMFAYVPHPGRVRTPENKVASKRQGQEPREWLLPFTTANPLPRLPTSPQNDPPGSKNERTPLREGSFRAVEDHSGVVLWAPCYASVLLGYPKPTLA